MGPTKQWIAFSSRPLARHESFLFFRHVCMHTTTNRCYASFRFQAQKGVNHLFGGDRHTGTIPALVLAGARPTVDSIRPIIGPTDSLKIQCLTQANVFVSSKHSFHVQVKKDPASTRGTLLIVRFFIISDANTLWRESGKRPA